MKKSTKPRMIFKISQKAARKMVVLMHQQNGLLDEIKRAAIAAGYDEKCGINPIVWLEARLAEQGIANSWNKQIVEQAFKYGFKPGGEQKVHEFIAEQLQALRDARLQLPKVEAYLKIMCVAEQCGWSASNGKMSLVDFVADAFESLRCGKMLIEQQKKDIDNNKVTIMNLDAQNDRYRRKIETLFEVIERMNQR